MDDSLTSAIDQWRKKQDDELSRPEAIRRLVEMGLKAKGNDNEVAHRTGNPILRY
jgi:hypothetical protein